MSAQQIKERFTSLPANQKAAAGLAAGGLFFLLSMCVCSGTTWFVASEVVTNREKARSKEELEKNAEKAADELKRAVAKVLVVPAFPGLAPEKKIPEPEQWLTPDKAAVVDGIKVELVEGVIGKLKYGKEDYFQVRLRITNNKENYVLEYYGFSDFSNRPTLIDEHGNTYRKSFHSRHDLLGSDKTKPRIDPGMSTEDLLVFDAPLASAKEFRLKLTGAAIKKDDATIGYKLPREFFVKK